MARDQTRGREGGRERSVGDETSTNPLGEQMSSLRVIKEK